MAQVRDPDEALDLVQETFVSAHRALGRFDPERSLAAWLSRIAINTCRDWARRRWVRRFWSMLLQAVEGLSQAEIAEALGSSAKAVELRVRRARAALGAARSKKL